MQITLQPKTPEPSSVEESHLWRTYIDSGRTDNTARNRIIELYMAPLEYFAQKMSVKLVRSSAEELVQFGSIGMIDAARRFKPERGWKFWTFALPRIRGAMLDGIRANDHISRAMRTNQKRVIKRTDSLRQLMGSEPSEDALVDSGLTVAQIRRLPPEVYSTDTPADAPQLLRNLVELACRSCAGMSQRKTDDFFREMTRPLTMQQQTIVYLYLVADITMAQIAAVLAVSESRISQEMTAALNTLRQYRSKEFATGLLAAG